MHANKNNLSATSSQTDDITSYGLLEIKPAHLFFFSRWSHVFFTSRTTVNELLN